MHPLLAMMTPKSSKEDLLIDIATLPMNVLTEASNITVPLDPMDYIEDMIADMVTVCGMALMEVLKTLLPTKSLKKILPIDDVSAASRDLMERATPVALVLAQILLCFLCLERVGTLKDLLGDSANLLATGCTQVLQLLVPLQLVKSNAESLMEESGISGVANMLLRIVRLEVVESLSDCLIESASMPAMDVVESVLPLVEVQLVDNMPDLFADIYMMPGVLMV
ncbi:hypothetical protein PR048_024555 [Dryococelus australis]|uniref:Uncharacterized protein n=1 Tax=Dryococelus australis TaxID=614101 RepID=A0ABQ9GNY1_9NEOP|nr:hypothetical protein PR048_024555 [Dryococelus australis]